MSQYKILEFLKNHPDDWYSVSDLTNKFHLAKASISCNCLKLKKMKTVDTMKVKKGKTIATYYKCKK